MVFKLEIISLGLVVDSSLLASCQAIDLNDVVQPEYPSFITRNSSGHYGMASTDEWNANGGSHIYDRKIYYDFS